jgi:hypothetical protein
MEGVNEDFDVSKMKVKDTIELKNSRTGNVGKYTIKKILGGSSNIKEIDLLNRSNQPLTLYYSKERGLQNFKGDVYECIMESALNEGNSDAFPTYNNGYAPGDYKYMKEMKSLLSKIEGISQYDDMDTTTDVYIKSSPNNSKTDLTRDIQKALKGFDDNLDLDNITSNIGNPRLISPNDQQKGIVTYKVPKKVQWWTLKRAAGDKPSTETQITPDIVFSLLDRMAQVSTTQHELADINWTSLDSFLDAAEDHMKPAQYTKFVKEIRKKYPKMK